jgi:hypothetical protein
MTKQIKTKDSWKDHERQVKNMRKRRCFQFRKVIKELRDIGFEVVEINQHQYRVNEVLDIFPNNKVYKNRKTHQNGKIKGMDFRSFIKQFFEIQ